MSYNLPLLSIAAFYILAQVPHGVAASIVTGGNIKKLDNRNPKSTELQDKLKKRLSARDFAKYERSESCHRNHLENLPLYIAAIFAGIYAERETGQKLGLTLFAGAFLAVRVLYTINYINVTSQGWSYLRSALYFTGMGLCLNMLFQAAKAIGASS